MKQILQCDSFKRTGKEFWPNFESGRYLLRGLVFSFFLILSAVSGQAQDAPAGEIQSQGKEVANENQPSSKGPHGGHWVPGKDPYAFELLFHRDGMLKVFLYYVEGQPVVIKGMPARWKLAPDSPYPLHGDFKISPGAEFYWVKFPPHNAEIVHLEIEVETEDGWLNANFFLPADAET